MKSGFSSFALRETRTHLTSRPVVIAMTGAALVLGVSGPFGTFDALQVLPRLAYWTMIVWLTYSCAIFMSVLASQLLPNQWPDWCKTGLSGFLSGPIIGLIVMSVNAATFPRRDPSSTNVSTDTAELFLYSTLISIALNILIQQATAAITPAASQDTSIPLLSRLSYANRGMLVSLHAQDHYVLVTTTKGQETILMRIGDAIKEVGPTAGFQTHRSHWVAQDQIEKAVQKGERGVLTLKTGAEVPVSRNMMSTLKSAGYF